MKILVTGASGFIGRRLVRQLLNQQYQIRVLVRDPKKCSEFENDCEIFVGDITQKETLRGCCKDIDVVFNLAALAGHDSPSKEAFYKYREVNVYGLKNLIEEAKAARIHKFIHISSTAAMGLLKLEKVDENTECKPYNPYQVTKREGEELLLKEFRENGFPAMILRPSMIYGPGFKGDLLTLAKVCKTGFFPKIGRRQNLSPALFVTDLIEVLPKCIDRGRVGEIYIIASEQSYSLKEVAIVISQAMKKQIHFIYVPSFVAISGAYFLEKFYGLIKKKPLVTKRNIQSTITDRVFCVDKAKEELGFKQYVTLEEGLTKTIKYFMDQKYI